eukprot:m.145532 g.145532  ORF g.145532 m.145532 type:complete len:112 (-) comp14118_c0_seq13:57-392(-)
MITNEASDKHENSSFGCSGICVFHIKTDELCFRVCDVIRTRRDNPVPRSRAAGTTIPFSLFTRAITRGTACQGEGGTPPFDKSILALFVKRPIVMVKAVGQPACQRVSACE